MTQYNTMSNRNTEIYEQWNTIQDIIGRANLWPHLIRRWFWTPDLNHFKRIIISAFVYVNGLNPVIFLEWVNLLGLARDRAAHSHFRALFRLFEAGHYSRALYGFNVTNRRYEYLDGSVRQYCHRSIRR